MMARVGKAFLMLFWLFLCYLVRKQRFTVSRGKADRKRGKVCFLATVPYSLFCHISHAASA